MKKINIAIIGYGGMGAYHAHNLIESGLYNVFAYDILPGRLEAAKRDGLKIYDSYQQSAQDSQLDAVLIATPNDSHRFYTEYFAAAGKHMICEKPVTTSSKELEAMLAAVKNHGVKFVVHQNRRWDTDYLMVKDIMKSNVIGGVYRLESKVVGSRGVPGEWRKIKEKGGGMMLDWGVHLIDQLLLMTDSKIKNLYCEMSYTLGFEVDDGFKLLLEFEDGLRAEIVVDTNCLVDVPRWIVYGMEGSAVIKNWQLEGEILLPLFEDLAKIKGEQAGNGFTKTMARRSGIEKKDLPEIRVEPYVFYKHFYDVLINEAECVIKNEQVMRVMLVMEAAFKSALNKRVLEVNL